jgi:hypothetical protein
MLTNYRLKAFSCIYALPQEKKQRAELLVIDNGTDCGWINVATTVQNVVVLWLSSGEKNLLSVDMAMCYCQALKVSYVFFRLK